MDVLVTGGAGFIGSAVARALVERGDDVRVLDNFLTGSSDLVPDGAELIKGDLRDPETMGAACRGAEVVFHQGAIRSVAKSVDDPLLSTECNVLGTLNVLMGAAEAGVRRVVYASSSSVYGENSANIQREDAVPNPMSPYAASKLAGEHYCRVWTRLYELSTVSLRYFNVFGPGQNPESKYSAVFPAFASALLADASPEVHGDGEQSRDFTFIDDVVRANLLAAGADERVDGAVVNVGAGDPKTVNEVLYAVSEAVGTWIEPRVTPPRPDDVRCTHADVSRALDLMGWSVSVSWADAVARTVSWFRDSRPQA